MPTSPLPAEEPKLLVLGDHRRQHQRILHVGVGSQQRVGQNRKRRVGFDFGLPAPSGDGRIGGRLAGRFYDMLDARPNALHTKFNS